MKNKLAIVIGHSEKSRGTWGVAPLDCYEWEYNRDVAQMVFKIAKEQVIDCQVFERKGYLQDDEEIKEVYGRVNDWCLNDNSNSVCIELHFNSFDGGKAEGSLALFDREPSDGLAFARTVYEEILPVFKRNPKSGKEARGFNLAGDGYKRGLKNLVAAKVTACILEPGFGDNKADAKKLHEYKIEYAYAIVRGALKFLNQRNNQREFAVDEGI